MPGSGITGGNKIAALSVAFSHRTDQVLRALVLETISRLVTKTPVDEGTARANWFVDTKITDPGGTDDTDKTGVGTIAAGVAAVAKLGVKDGHVYITNGLAYIEALEKGHSQQAANGMVAVTVAELKALVPGLVKEIKQNG